MKWLKKIATGCLFILGLTLAFSLPALSQPPKDTSIYVYMEETRSGFRRFTGTVFMDDKKIAEISENRYLVLHPALGKHSFYVKSKKSGGVEIEIAENTTYFIKLTATFEAGSTRFRSVSIVPKEEGEFAIKQLKPIRKADILDAVLVDMNVVSP